MTQIEFLTFSQLLSKNVLFKFWPNTLQVHAPFRVLDLRQSKKGHRICADSISIPGSYTKPLEINPLKKKDLLSILDLLDTDCQNFFKGLPMSRNAIEFDELEDNLESDSDE
ncbi:hypothetical protein PR048_010781 [Dryococelus australis]|uniref:Uncharacterized protein n=1 Tax=Dryococelus australis TaxID=614101 RepID=A0ABQ9I4Q8_9NEOP|nr:hypothetical protein PR048_010781 [Dryococelus australis]